ncbi:hypothetical protein GGX14DRAFT_388125 [Mycena pura]|uniref:Uncharacterized protein n=1 Tax=Mycena pura TaxID=153505 RepID=A0AAD7E006_9AGAR|nr:hypothetical protein GGX14DRAFT_388125 [Mycena pura]
MRYLRVEDQLNPGPVPGGPDPVTRRVDPYPWASLPEGKRSRGSGGSLVVAANLQTSKPPNLRIAEPPGGLSSPEWGQQPGEEVNLGGVRRKGLYVLSLPADWPVWPQVSSERDREWQTLWRGFDPLRPWQGGGGGGDERERAEVEASMVPSEVVRCSEGGAEGSRGRVEASRRPGSHMGEFQGLWDRSGILLGERAPEVWVATRRYWEVYGGTRQNVGAPGGMRSGSADHLQAVGCAEQARKGGDPLTRSVTPFRVLSPAQDRGSSPTFGS